MRDFILQLDPSIVVAFVNMGGVFLTTAGVVVVGFMQHRMRRDMQTNHGSKNIGDATDKNTTRLISIGDNLASLQSLFLAHVKESNEYIECNKDALAWAEARRRESIASEGKD